MNNQIYFGNFTCLQDVCREYAISENEIAGCEIIYAHYDTPDYEGYAHVIFLKDGKLYEINTSHCSCYGLSEYGWSAEETSFAALMFRPNVTDFAKANLKERFKGLVVFL